MFEWSNNFKRAAAAFLAMLLGRPQATDQAS
jgi:hypothetical protein